MDLSKFKPVGFNQSITDNETKETIDNDNKKDDETKEVEISKGNEDATLHEEGKDVIQGQEQKVTLDDNSVLDYLKNKGVQVESFEDLSKQKDQQELPQEIKSYLEYRSETNRGFEDYLALQKDWSNEKEDVAIAKYLKDKNPYFTDQDIKDEISEFSYDESLDEDIEIRKKQRDKKKLLSEALEYLNGQKEKYKTKVEGSSQDVEIPEDYKKSYEELSELKRSQQQQIDLATKRQQSFLSETKEKVFNEEFKGFEFEVNGNKKLFKSGNSDDVLNQQSDINIALSKHIDKEGKVIDVKEYHKALNAFMNYDKLFQHAYELGATEAIAQETKDSKNLSFVGRKTHENPSNFKSKKFIPVQNNNNIVRGRIVKR